MTPAKPHAHFVLTLLLGLGVLDSCQSAADAGPGGGADPALASALSHRFDDSPGGAPRGWLVGTTNPRAGARDARWEVRADPGARSPANVLALTDAAGHVGQAFNLCWDPELSFADVDITVAVRADEGVEDQGGGPAWRIAGASDYYVARWNPLEDNVRVYSVRGGERLQLDSARVRVDPESWHTLRVRHVGDAITCWFDGQEVLHVRDSKLTAAGAVGLWTKADAMTSFDDLLIGPVR